MTGGEAWTFCTAFYRDVHHSIACICHGRSESRDQVHGKHRAERKKRVAKIKLQYEETEVIHAAVHRVHTSSVASK